jgi:predicted amidohydrolase
MPDVQMQKQLLDRLKAASPLDDATAFALLWTYFETIGLSEVENAFAFHYVLPQALEPFPKKPESRRYSAAQAVDKLTSMLQVEAFDQLAVAWLKGIDLRLAVRRGTFEASAIRGFDDRLYRVRPTNNFVASWFANAGREVAGSRKQSISLAAYCRHFRVVPASAVHGFNIRCVSSSEWGNPFIDDRLHSAAAGTLTFLCWPLRTPLRTDDTPAANGGLFVRVSVAAGDDERRQELARAVAAARETKAAILLLPELSIAERDVLILREILSAHDDDDFPVLTVAGIEHTRRADAWVNEAVALGPDGRELRRFRKLSRFGATGLAEDTQTGTRFDVLESPIGNLAVLICLDVFHPKIRHVVEASHANVLLAPSLSPSTSAHESAARGYLSSNLSTTVVSNRGTERPDEARNGTFALLPGKLPQKSHGNDTILLRIGRDEDSLLIAIQ